MRFWMMSNQEIKSSEYIPDFRGSLHVVARYPEDEFPWAKSICFHP